MIGLFLGSVLGGNLTDYFGRINTMKLCTVMISIFLLLPAMIIRRLPVEMFMLKYSIIFVSRVMAQGFEQTSWITGTIYTIEISGPTKRAICGSFFHFLYSLGWMTSSLVGLLAPDWVDYSIATAIFTLILLPALFWIPPSIPHLFQTGKSSEAMEALEKMTKILDVKIPLDFKTKYSKNNFNVEAKKDQNRHNVLDLLRHARPRRMVLMTTSIFICTVMVLYGLAYNAAGLPGNLYVNNSMNGIGHLVAAAFWILLVPHFGRRTLMAASLFIMSLCCFLSVTLQRVGEIYDLSYSEVFIQSGRWVAFGGISAVLFTVICIYIYFCELFPTEMRGMSIGFISAISRIGSLLAPELIFIEKENKNNLFLKSIPMAIFSMLGVVAGVIALHLPETKDQPMLHSLEDAEKFYEKNEKRLKNFRKRSIDNEDLLLN